MKLNGKNYKLLENTGVKKMCQACDFGDDNGACNEASASSVCGDGDSYFILETNPIPDVVDVAGLNKLSELIHKANKEKGFWNNKRELGTSLMLCASELTEALAADQVGRYANLKTYKECEKADMVKSFKDHIKDTFEDELADTIIRVLDLCGSMGIDIEQHIKLKLEYNKTRPVKHGKLY